MKTKENISDKLFTGNFSFIQTLINESGLNIQAIRSEFTTVEDCWKTNYKAKYYLTVEGKEFFSIGSLPYHLNRGGRNPENVIRSVAILAALNFKIEWIDIGSRLMTAEQEQDEVKDVKKTAFAIGSYAFELKYWQSCTKTPAYLKDFTKPQYFKLLKWSVETGLNDLQAINHFVEWNYNSIWKGWYINNPYTLFEGGFEWLDKQAKNFKCPE